MAKDFLTFIDKNKKGTIPISYFEEHGYLIKEKYYPRVDYLEVINNLEV